MSILNWLRRLWKPPPVEEHLSHYQEAVLRYSALPVPTFEIYANRKRLEVLFRYMERYTEVIRRCELCLKTDKHYTLPDDTKLISVPLADFYLRKNNHYGNPVSIQTDFVQASIALITLYERRSEEPNQSSALSNNLYRFLPVINNLIALSTHLAT